MTNGKNKDGERRKLGRNQESLLRAMIEHGGRWSPGTWTWGPRSETKRLLGVLKTRNCVRRGATAGGVALWIVTDEGHAALGELKAGNAGLIGRRIVDMRPMTDDEAALEGWRFSGVHGAPTVLVLDDGTKVYPARDHEGNGPGALFGEQDGATVVFRCRVVEVGASNEQGGRS